MVWKRRIYYLLAFKIGEYIVSWVSENEIGLGCKRYIRLAVPNSIGANNEDIIRNAKELENVINGGKEVGLKVKGEKTERIIFARKKKKIRWFWSSLPSIAHANFRT